METRDPDDVLTLCLLATHSAVQLAAVTVNPGTLAQIGLVRTVLARLGVNAPVGARVAHHSGDAVSPFHRTWLGETATARPDAVAHELLARILTEKPDSVLLTAAPLHNFRLLLRNHTEVTVQCWVAQGGFAGDNVVPQEDRLPKFAGLNTCESYNFGHDAKGAIAALSSDRVRRRRLVSKNVTHGVAWNGAMHQRIKALNDMKPGVRLAVEAMEIYLREYPEGKFLHDPLAAAAMIDPAAFEWEEVEVYRERGRWGARPRTGTDTLISTSVNAVQALSAVLELHEVNILEG
ncbi:nucleoside hydrolase [Streptomyces sp. NPDC127033]|uniref:nucleoside hydrolase n=1 Tax=Streptomyces sp. NPDC127033 TaxID=3347110 RepID=UPI003651CF58